MEFHHAPHQRQADAQAALGAGVRVARLREHLEDVTEQMARNADAGVAHLHDDASIASSAAHFHCARRAA